LEPLVNPLIYKDLTFEQVYLMFKETDMKFRETDMKFQETDRQIKENNLQTDRKFQETAMRFQETEKQFKETDRRLKDLGIHIGGIANSNGLVAEEYFYNVLSNTMKVGNLEFDYIDYNIKRKRKNTVAQYDILLYNATKVLIVEVKYNFTIDQLREFHEIRLSKYRILFPDNNNQKIYAAIAGMTISDETIAEAEKWGFFILTPLADAFTILNSPGFVPKVF